MGNERWVFVLSRVHEEGLIDMQGMAKVGPRDWMAEDRMMIAG